MTALRVTEIARLLCFYPHALITVDYGKILLVIAAW